MTQSKQDSSKPKTVEPKPQQPINVPVEALKSAKKMAERIQEQNIYKNRLPQNRTKLVRALAQYDEELAEAHKKMVEYRKHNSERSNASQQGDFAAQMLYMAGAMEERFKLWWGISRERGWKEKILSYAKAGVATTLGWIADSLKCNAANFMRWIGKGEKLPDFNVHMEMKKDGTYNFACLVNGTLPIADFFAEEDQAHTTMLNRPLAGTKDEVAARFEAHCQSGFELWLKSEHGCTIDDSDDHTQYKTDFSKHKIMKNGQPLTQNELQNMDKSKSLTTFLTSLKQLNITADLKPDPTPPTSPTP